MLSLFKGIDFGDEGFIAKSLQNRVSTNVENNFHRFNRLSRRKRGMASNLLFIMTDFFLQFQTNFAMATLGLKEMEKFLPT